MYKEKQLWVCLIARKLQLLNVITFFILEKNENGKYELGQIQDVLRILYSAY